MSSSFLDWPLVRPLVLLSASGGVLLVSLAIVAAFVGYIWFLRRLSTGARWLGAFLGLLFIIWYVTLPPRPLPLSAPSQPAKFDLNALLARQRHDMNLALNERRALKMRLSTLVDDVYSRAHHDHAEGPLRRQKEPR